MACNTGKGRDFLMNENQGFRARDQLAVPILEGVETGLSAGLHAAPAARAVSYLYP